jgi:hypothetical protein
MRDRAAGKIIGNNRARSSEYQAECSKTFRDQFFRKHAGVAIPDRHSCVTENTPPEAPERRAGFIRCEPAGVISK